MKKTIVLYLDDLDCEFAIQTLLESAGYIVRSVRSAEECKRAIEKIKPDLVLIDGFKPKEGILKIITKFKKTKMAYYNPEELDSEMEYKFENVLGSIESNFDNKSFLAKIKKLIGS
jgi:DNA-binding NtrC family response regulator